MQHPVLRNDVLQHVMGFLELDELRAMALTCRHFYHVSLRNALWRDVWLRYPHQRPLCDAERALLISEGGEGFGHEGFLRNLLLQRAPLHLNQTPL